MTDDVTQVFRDGTSQSARALAALAPEYVKIDGRTLTDHLAFTRAFAEKIRFFPSDGSARELYWDGWISQEDVSAAQEFMDDPSRFDPATSPRLFRPHFLLLLVFLRQLEALQVELNSLTRRHLDFYYRRVLGMTRKRAVPDSVHVIVELAADHEQILLPAKTPLDAGQDHSGRDRVYVTDRDVVVNRVQVARLCSLFAECRKESLATTTDRHPESKNQTLMAMLRLALGDPLPRYADGKEVTFRKLQKMRGPLNGIVLGFGLKLGEARDFMLRLRRHDQVGTERSAKQDGRDLAAMAGIIERAAGRTASPLSVPTRNPAPGAKLAGVRRLWDGSKPEFGVETLERYFHMPAEDFMRLMNEAEAFEPSWVEIRALLEQTHQRRLRRGRTDKFRELHTAGRSTSDLIFDAVGTPPPGRSEADAMERAASYLSTRDLSGLRDAIQRNDRERVYSILEVLQRNRFGESEPEVREVLRLHPAGDATAVLSDRILAGDAKTGPWKTFGAKPKAPGSTPVVGLALTSPALLLREGTRTITLTLKFQDMDVDAKALTDGVVVQFGTAKDWVEPRLVKLEATPDGVVYTITLTPEDDAVLAVPAEIVGIPSPWPFLRLMFRPRDGADASSVAYGPLARLVLRQLTLKVSGRGLTALYLENEGGVIDPKKPFEPFGSAPIAGSRLRIFHPELECKNLDSVTLEWTWMTKLRQDHYKRYTPSISGFTGTLSIVNLRTGARYPGAPPEHPLFRSVLNEVTEFAAEASAKIPHEGQQFPAESQILPRTLRPDDAGGAVSEWRRCLQWELNAPDFQHGTYPTLLAANMMAYSQALAKKTAETVRLTTDAAAKPPIVGMTESAPSAASAEWPNPSEYALNPPYTPKLKTLTLGYETTVCVSFAGSQPPDTKEALVYHVHPFGYRGVEKEPLGTGVRFFPQYDNEGELYLGLQGVAAPQTVSILFQMAEGSSDPTRDVQTVEWSYLSGNCWSALTSRPLTDDMRGFIGSGIVELTLAAADPSTLMPTGLYWIRAAMRRETVSACETIAVLTQAVSATYLDRHDAPGHYDAPLPAGTIKALAADVSGVAVVSQPYNSWGGRPPEGASRFDTRVSERLRHKQRAVSVWDYERLVLEQFPEVYKVKCIPAAQEPGVVNVIIIPDLRKARLFDAFKPMAPASLLLAVKTYLVARASQFAEIRVRNARYLAVRVRIAVRFRDAGNELFFVTELETEIKRFLSPWAYDEGRDVVLGGKIYANSVVDFVERLEYVDYVAQVRLFLYDDDGKSIPLPADAMRPSDEDGYLAGDQVEADAPDAVLVTAVSHDIDVLGENFYSEDQPMNGIGYMKIGLDFQVVPKQHTA